MYFAVCLFIGSAVGKKGIFFGCGSRLESPKILPFGAKLAPDVNSFLFFIFIFFN